MNSKLLSRFGYTGLGQAFYRFFSTHLGYMVFTSLHSAFMTTLLIRVTGDSAAAMKFNIIHYLVMGPAMALSVYVTKKTSPVFTLRTGIAMYLMMYLTFFLTLEHLGQSMPLLAFFSGMGSGTYWYANNLGLGGYLEDDNRDKGLGLMSMGEGVVSLTVPFLSGTIISRFEGLAGYLVVFGLGLAVATFTVLMSMTLAPLSGLGSRTHYRQALKISFCNKSFFLMMSANLIKGLRAGTMGFFMNLILYETVKSEFAVGLSTLLSGLVAIAGAALYGRIVREKNRFRSMLISTTVLMAGALALLHPTPVVIILFSMLNGFCGCFLQNPTMSIYFSAIQQPEYQEMQGEFHGIKEMFMTVGRVAGILFAMFGSSLLSPAVVVLLLTVTQYLMVAMQLPVKRALEQRRHS